MKIIITGGNGSLGKNLCKEFKGEIHVLDKEKPKQKLNHVKYHEVDITSKKVISVLKKIGEVDLVINNAGVMRRGKITEISEEDFDFCIDVNFKGSWLVSRYAKLKKTGILLFINSRHGEKIKNEPSIYSLSKVALKYLALLFKNQHIIVKEAYLGPFIGGVSKTGYSDSEYALRKKDKAETMAKLIRKLVEGKETKLMFNEKTQEYYFKK